MPTGDPTCWPSLTASPDPVLVNGNITYVMTVANNGPSIASTVSLVNRLPGGTTYVSATSSQGSCSGTTTVTCALGNIANGAKPTVTVVAKATTVGNLNDTTSVTAATSDPNSNNNSSRLQQFNKKLLLYRSFCRIYNHFLSFENQ